MNRPPNLSRNQRAWITSAAASLPRSQRAYFIADVAKHLAGTPSDYAVIEAINVLLDRAITTPAFLCDSASVPPKEPSYFPSIARTR